jgi:ATP-binding cassette subfamily B protein
MRKLFNKKSFTEYVEAFTVSKRLLGILWQGDKFVFLGTLISVAIPAINPFINAYIYKLIIDLIIEGVGGNFNYGSLYFLLGMRFGTLTLQYIAFSTQVYMDLLRWTKVPVFLYQMILSKLSTLDVAYFENSKFKDTLQRVRESYAWRPLNLYSTIFYSIQSLIQLTIAFIALVSLNFALSLALILAAVPAFINQLYYSKTLWGVWSSHSPYRKRFWYLSDLIQDKEGVKEMRIFGTAKKFLSEVARMQRRFAKDNISIGRKRLRNSLVLNFLGTAVYLAIEAMVAVMTITGKITVGTLSYFTFVIWNFEGGIHGFFGNITQVFDHSHYVKDIFKLLDFEPAIRTPRNAIKISRSSPPKIEFKNVVFSYPNSKKKVLNNFSLIINPGEKIAFVGDNGAGKTTVIKLLARFYDVTSGEILINGTNIKNLDLSSWYQALGVIFQDFIKYEYTLEENIRFGKLYEAVAPGSIEEAARLSGAHAVAEGLPNRYKQMLGKTFRGGIDLSLGQWQKVALARAFLRDAPILVLDEPTASIDARSEKEIFDKVEKLGENKTVIIISHRFSTVRNADKIYVLDKGKISESGSHDALMQKKGTYSKLFTIQAERYR